MVATESRMRAWTLAVLLIALCSTPLATASPSIVALTDEKIQSSKSGTLHYHDLSDEEKVHLFQKFMTDTQRMVRDDCDDKHEWIVYTCDN